MPEKILIVDDDVDNLGIIVRYIEEAGTDYEILQALNAKLAMTIAQNELPNLIITDWEMPVIDGIALVKMLKEDHTTKNIPIVMCTGAMTSSEHLRTALEAGAIDYIRKPIDKIELLARVRSMLALSSSHQEILDLKNRELASTALNILKNNEFNQEMLGSLKEINLQFGIKNKGLEKYLNELIQIISFKIKSEAWEQFKTYFDNVHPGFLKKLATRFPTLTPAEIKLASFLRLNLTTKEISNITFNSPKSIKTSRNRLRKKLELDPKTNIVTFLLSL